MVAVCGISPVSSSFLPFRHHISLCSPICGVGISDCRCFPEPILKTCLGILASITRLAFLLEGREHLSLTRLAFLVQRREQLSLTLWPHVSLFDIWLRGMGKRSAGRQVCTSAPFLATDCTWTTLELNSNRAPYYYRATV